MKQLSLILKAFALGAIAFTLAPDVAAQASRTWVSGVGNDANPCSLTAPCKTFAGAIGQTADGGIIDVLDSGGYGSVTITKNIIIDGSGGSIAGVLTAGTNGIVVSGQGIHVILRNLDIEGTFTAGAPNGLSGIDFLQGASLQVEHCRVFGFSTAGINASLAGSGQLMVKDTIVSDSNIGVQLSTSAGQLLTTFDNVTVQNTSTFGVKTAGTGTVYAMMKRSNVSNNVQHGIYAGSATSVITLIDSSSSFNNGTGVFAAVSGARIRMSGNTVVNNNAGIGIAAGATVESDGTNRVAGFNSSQAPNATFTSQ